MKKAIMSGALVVSLLAGGMAVMGSSNLLAMGSEKDPAKFEERQQHRLEHMTEALNLTSDQQTKIKALFEKQHAKMKAIHEETHTKVLALLTPDQKAQYEKLREERGKKE